MKFRLAVAAAALATSGLANAATIDWNTWSSNTNGTIATSSGPVTVTYRGEMSGFYTNYPSWNPSDSFADGTIVDNGPTGTNGIVRLIGGFGNEATVDSITFSAPVLNPVISIWSLGQSGDTASFRFRGVTPVLVAGGPSDEYDGGSIVVNGNTVSGTEGNGTVQFLGTYTSLSWTNPVAENWYGFNVGASEVTAVPEPGSVGLLLAGLTLLGLARRRAAR